MVSMRSLILISFATLALGQGGNTCARYTCATTAHSLGAGECSTGVLMNTYNQYYVKACSSGSVCPDNGTLSTTQCVAVTYNAYPGNKCDSTMICQGTSVCTNKVCKGVAKAGTCTANVDCDPGLYCAAGVCADQ